jgi:hypothetical protein
VKALEQAHQGVPPFLPDLAARLLAEFARLAEARVSGPQGSDGPSTVPGLPGSPGSAPQSDSAASPNQGGSPLAARAPPQPPCHVFDDQDNDSEERSESGTDNHIPRLSCQQRRT